jgi:hypothetical protein
MDAFEELGNIYQNAFRYYNTNLLTGNKCLET